VKGSEEAEAKRSKGETKQRRRGEEESLLFSSAPLLLRLCSSASAVLYSPRFFGVGWTVAGALRNLKFTFEI